MVFVLKQSTEVVGFRFSSRCLLLASLYEVVYVLLACVDSVWVHCYDIGFQQGSEEERLMPLCFVGKQLQPMRLH